MRASYVPIVDVNGGTGDEVRLISELEREDLEAKREPALTVVQVVLADDVLAGVQVLVESVQLDAVLLDGRHDAR